MLVIATPSKVRGEHTDGCQCDKRHGAPDGDFMPLLRYKTEQEGTERAFGDGHADDGEALADAFV